MMGSALAQKTPNGVLYDAQIIRVTDGDIVVIAAHFDISGTYQIA